MLCFRCHGIFPTESSSSSSRRHDGFGNSIQSYLRRNPNESNRSPYLNLEPHDMTIQVWQYVALVTFHLDRPSSLGRRTWVLHRQAQQWQIRSHRWIGRDPLKLVSNSMKKSVSRVRIPCSAPNPRYQTAHGKAPHGRSHPGTNKQFRLMVSSWYRT